MVKVGCYERILNRSTCHYVIVSEYLVYISRIHSSLIYRGTRLADKILIVLLTTSDVVLLQDAIYKGLHGNFTNLLYIPKIYCFVNKTDLSCFPVVFFVVSPCLRPF